MATPLHPHEGLSPDFPTPIDTTPLPPAKVGYKPGDVTTEEIYNQLGRPSGWYPITPPGDFSGSMQLWRLDADQLWNNEPRAWNYYANMYRWNDSAPYAVVPYWRRAQRISAPGVQFRKSRYSRRRYRRRWRL